MPVWLSFAVVALAESFFFFSSHQDSTHLQPYHTLLELHEMFPNLAEYPILLFMEDFLPVSSETFDMNRQNTELST